MTVATRAASRSSAEPTSALRLALGDAGPHLTGLIPFGILLGVTIGAVGADPLAGLLGAFIVFAGSAQLTAVTLLDRGLNELAVVMTAAVVNLRFLLYSAALGERFRAQPRAFRWLAPHFLIDQTYLLAHARPGLSGVAFRRYWIWLGCSILAIWSGSIAIGIGVAPVMPPLPHLGLAGGALFVGLLVPRLADRPAVLAATVGGAGAAACSLVAPAAAIIVGAIAGITAGLVADQQKGATND